MTVTEAEDAPDIPIDLARTTLLGDIRDHLLEYLKHSKEVLPWNQLGEEKQRDLVARTERFARDLLVRTVGIVAAEGREPLLCSVKKIESVKGNIVVKIETAFRNGPWAELGTANTVMVKVADIRSFDGERRRSDVHVHKDQPDLPIDKAEAKDEGPVMDKTTAGEKLNGSKRRRVPRSPDPDAVKPATDGWFEDEERTKLATKGYLALAHMIQMAAPEAPDAVLRKLQDHYRILDKAIDREKLFKIAEVPLPEEGEGSAPEIPEADIPAFLRKPPPPEAPAADEPEPGPSFQ